MSISRHNNRAQRSKKQLLADATTTIILAHCQQKQLAVSRIMLDTIWNITFSAEIMFTQTTNECTTLRQMENDCGCIRNSSLKSHLIQSEHT